MAKDEITAWSDHSALLELDFNTKLERRRELTAIIKDAETELDDLNKDLQAAMAVADVTKVVWNGMTASIRNGSSPSKVDKKLLIQRGVDPDLIADCTIPGKGYSYFFLDDPANRTKKDKAQLEATGGDAA